MTELSRASAKRTTESSPALQCWVKVAINIQKPVKRATDVLREFCRPLRGLTSTNMSLIPAMNRWAIFNRLYRPEMARSTSTSHRKIIDMCSLCLRTSVHDLSGLYSLSKVAHRFIGGIADDNESQLLIS